jgi:hypothetical protein
MERANLDVRTSRELLAQFEQLLELQVADRDRLRQAIDPDETTPAPAGSAGRDKGS